MRIGHGWLSLLACGALATMAGAQTFAPMINKTSPSAVPLGQTTECEITSAFSLVGADKVLCSGSGVTGEVVPVAPKPGETPAPARADGRLSVRFTVAQDAELGLRDFRLLTPRGPSTLGQVVVVRDPIVREDAAAHKTLQTAQPVAWPATLCGRIESREEVDYYKFRVEAGTTLTFNMFCQRLQLKLAPLSFMADPMITLRNSAGTVLGSNDNFFYADPLLCQRFDRGGDYYLEVRDNRYQGFRHWEYVIEIHDRPLVRQTFPNAISPATATSVRLQGCNMPDDAQAILVAPPNAPDGPVWLTPVLEGRPLNPVPVWVSRLPADREIASAPATSAPGTTAPGTTAPGKAAPGKAAPGKAAPGKAAEPQPVRVPVAVCGVIEKPENVDRYVFEAHQSDRFTFLVAARSTQSQLDSYLRILNEKGEVLAENDDDTDKTGHPESRNEIVTPDSRIENWPAPADGRYVVEVSDVHQRGGECFSYCLQVRPAQPHFLVDIDSDKTAVAPGVAAVIFARAARREGFAGEIRLSIENLPRGVNATCGTIHAGEQDGCILLQAAPDASREPANIRVYGTADLEDAGQTHTLTVAARPLEELEVGGGPRYLVPVALHTLAVVESLDLKSVHIEPRDLAIKPGETRSIAVTIERAPGFKDPVTLSTVHRQHVWVFGNCLPTGVTLDESASKARIVDDQVQGTLVLKAAPTARPVDRQLVPIMAHVPINFSLKMIYCGEPLWLTVEPAAP